MNQNELLYDMIFKRKSFHLFRNIGEESISKEELRDIEETYKKLTPLFPEIRTAIRIVPAKETTCKRGQEYCILLYSEKKSGYLQNVGYLGKRGIMPAAQVSYYNRIDIGIFLCFMELCLKHRGAGYERVLYEDLGTDAEKTLVATYRI